MTSAEQNFCTRRLISVDEIIVSATVLLKLALCSFGKYKSVSPFWSREANTTQFKYLLETINQAEGSKIYIYHFFLSALSNWYVIDFDFFFNSCP